MRLYSTLFIRHDFNNSTVSYYRVKLMLSDLDSYLIGYPFVLVNPAVVNKEKARKDKPHEPLLEKNKPPRDKSRGG